MFFKTSIFVLQIPVPFSFRSVYFYQRACGIHVRRVRVRVESEGEGEGEVEGDGVG